MNYSEALNYLGTFIDYEKIPGANYAASGDPLTRTRLFLEYLGDPHRDYPSVIVAGTKGKGSTCAMLASILGATGRRVGLYTQPHLHTYRERIRIGDELIPHDCVASAVTRIARAVEMVHRDHAELGRITWYELGTAMAFCHFSERRVDVAVLEVGLGGRLDATNVVDPLVSVITPISLDHTQVLGNTLALIAREKAGIIKQGRPVVSAPQADEALAVIRGVCAERGASLLVVGETAPWPRSIVRPPPATSRTAGYLSVDLGGSRRDYGTLEVPLLGRVQATNAAVAVATIDELDSAGISVPIDAARAGLRATRWPGRLEIIAEQPIVVADGAHNDESARELGIALGEYFAPTERAIVLGVGVDKDARSIVRGLLAASSRFVVTRSRHARSADPQSLAHLVIGEGGQAWVEPSVSAAIESARAIVGPAGLVCATGSLFVAAEAREWAGLAVAE